MLSANLTATVLSAPVLIVSPSCSKVPGVAATGGEPSARMMLAWPCTASILAGTGLLRIQAIGTRRRVPGFIRLGN